MSITSIIFVLFLFATLIIYYIVPKRFQWVILLLSSTAFYLLSSLKGAIFVLVTAGTVYGATRFLQNISDQQKQYFRDNKETLSKEDKNRIKAENKKRRKALLICTLLLNFGIMCVCKYAHFAVDSVNSLLSFAGGSTINNEFSIIVPLGLSFYTFQSMGYLINVYWENYKAEKNFFKVLLFVSFFPQMTQGPISEYEQLSKELFSEHTFTYKNYSWGMQRLIWGFVKKMVIADVLSPWVQDLFQNYNSYTNVSVFIGMFMYSVQIYADFSGYMDIMCGYCETLGITLTENFERPYFSKSIAEYWRRWHISLGAWFKNYIYYPIGISRWNRNLGKKLNDKFGKAVGKNLPATLALIVVWLTTGLWHGASWAYIAWGGVNGLFIIVSMWLEPVYAKVKSTLHIKENSWLWKAFTTLRTFILVTFIKVLPEVGTLSAGFGLWKRVFTVTELPTSITTLIPYIEIDIWLNILITFGLIGLMLIFSLVQRKKPVREYFNKLPLVIRMGIELIAVFLIAYIGFSAESTGGFLYAGF